MSRYGVYLQHRGPFALPAFRASFQRWLAETKERFAFVGTETFPMPRYDQRDRQLLVIDHVVVYSFKQR